MNKIYYDTNISLGQVIIAKSNPKNTPAKLFNQKEKIVGNKIWNAIFGLSTLA